jgi:TatD DNase family protein
MLADSHCHLDLLDLPSFPGGLAGVLEAARAQGVTQFLCVAINL